MFINTHIVDTRVNEHFACHTCLPIGDIIIVGICQTGAILVIQTKVQTTLIQMGIKRNDYLGITRHGEAVILVTEIRAMAKVYDIIQTILNIFCRIKGLLEVTLVIVYTSSWPALMENKIIAPRSITMLPNAQVIDTSFIKLVVNDACLTIGYVVIRG